MPSPPPQKEEGSAERSRKTADLKAEFLQVPRVVELMENWKAEEKKGARYVTAEKAVGSEIAVVLPPVPEEKEAELGRTVSRMLSECFPDAAEQERAAVREELLEWFSPHTHERVIQLSLAQGQISIGGGPLRPVESLTGSWLDIEDSNNIKDELHYLDYGKILAGGRISDEMVSGRYGHLFRVDDEP